MRQPRVHKGTTSGGQFAATSKDEPSVELHAITDPSLTVTVPDPDDPFGMPIYEGPAADAGGRLVPGMYPAYASDDDDPTDYVLVVPDPAAVVWVDDPSGGTHARRGVVSGVDVMTAFTDPSASDDDVQMWRTVTRVGDTAPLGTTSFDWESGLWLWTDRDGRTGQADSEDQAVTALVRTSR
jgi:hypothetical protein